MSSRNVRFASMARGVGWLRLLLPLFALVRLGDAGACNYQDIKVTDCSNGNDTVNAKYDDKPGVSLANQQIALCPASSTTTWTIAAESGCNPTTPTSTTDITCTSMELAVTGGTPTFSGTSANPAGTAAFTVTATDSTIPGGSCTRNYGFNYLYPPNIGGWGDVHVITVDNVHYNFQAAGEFTALRTGSVNAIAHGSSGGAGGTHISVHYDGGMEIQTRQTPVATAPPVADSYSGLATCVSVYSAVAARVGSHRFSYQPIVGSNGAMDPSGMQLRVDGTLTTLGASGIDLPGSPVSGRIVQPWGGDGIEVDYSNGTTLMVTPTYWPGQQIWYLNVNVYGAAESMGVFGPIPDGSWLPALPNGSSVGSMPPATNLDQRYNELYGSGQFADQWRVTSATSLFDYAPGTSTATFTNTTWPNGNNPKSCAVPNQPVAQPVDVTVAQKACSAITDTNMHNDCVFDVSSTGFTGFAQTYQLSQQRLPSATQTTVKGDRAVSEYGQSVTFTATVAPTAANGGGTATGTVQFTLDGGNAGSPIALDSSGHAQWSIATLPLGQHQIAGQYAPTGGWGALLASTSAAEAHSVIAPGFPYWWLVVLLIILIVLLIWWYLRKH